MSTVLPFRGLRYSDSFARPSVFSPPYDVISSEQRRHYLERDPHNVVRLTLGPTPDDAQWHSHAARALRQWIRDGVLVRDRELAFYGYCQHFFLDDGAEHVRVGFIGRVALTDWGDGIYRHEHTRHGPKADRLSLLRATLTNMSPIFGLYHDATGAITRWLAPPSQPLLDFWGDDGIRHVLWRIDDAAAIGGLSAALSQRPIVIADGHHRYETALAYAHERRRAAAGHPPGPQPYDYAMMYLTAAESPGLTILATHRVIRGNDAFDAEAFLRALSTDFDVEPAPEDTLSSTIAGHADEGTVIGLCLGTHGDWILHLNDGERIRAIVDEGVPEELADLDVVVLQRLVLEPHLGISYEDLASTDRITYTIDERQACREVHQGQAQAAFILNPTTMNQVWRAAQRGLTMPQKSTYFYPKLLTGLVFNPLHGVAAHAADVPHAARPE